MGIADISIALSAGPIGLKRAEDFLPELGKPSVTFKLLKGSASGLSIIFAALSRELAFFVAQHAACKQPVHRKVNSGRHKTRMKDTIDRPLVFAEGNLYRSWPLFSVKAPSADMPNSRV